MTPHKPFGELSDAEKGALLLAHHEGKRIQYMRNGFSPWCVASCPNWNEELCYRIAPEPKTPDTINWEHVGPRFNFMTRDRDGDSWLYENRPIRTEHDWGDPKYGDLIIAVETFASYCRGTVDWKDSLVIRPGYEGKP